MLKLYLPLRTVFPISFPNICLSKSYLFLKVLQNLFSFISFFYIPSLYTTPTFSESSVSLHPSYDIYNILCHTNITFMRSLALLPYCRVFITARRGFCLACKIIGIKYLLNWVIKRWHLYKFFENLRKSLYKLKMSLFLVMLSSYSKTDTWFYYFQKI